MKLSTRDEKIKACIALAVIILAVVLAIIYSVVYEVEGEANMPFKLSKITVVSTAEGVQKDDATELWNLSIFQNNDVYFTIEKNENNKKENIIEEISIKNIKVLNEPKIGNIKTYMPNSSEGRLFTYTDDTVVEDSKLSYKGALKTDNKALEIGNQGGMAVIRFSNVDIGEYISDEAEEIKHDGTMIKKTDATLDDLKFTVNFDFIIRLKDNSYKANITIDLPCDDNLIKNGTSNKEITDKFVFKRI